MEVLIKDTRRYADTRGWGFFEYGGEEREPSAQLPKAARCYACHAANGRLNILSYSFIQPSSPSPPSIRHLA